MTPICASNGFVAHMSLTVRLSCLRGMLPADRLHQICEVCMRTQWMSDVLLTEAGLSSHGVQSPYGTVCKVQLAQHDQHELISRSSFANLMHSLTDDIWVDAARAKCLCIVSNGCYVVCRFESVAYQQSTAAPSCRTQGSLCSITAAWLHATKQCQRFS